uniref:Uncharacterized protein n=1 Tax=Hyaloperonospora arabidopsidis (strain Emoy2) TaxID=559515 RepID=M4BQC9_HYAAE
MKPAGIRLDLINATEKLTDEIAVPLLKSAREVDVLTCGDEVIGGPTYTLDIESCLLKEFTLQMKQFGASTHELSVRRLPVLVPTIMYNRTRNKAKVRMTNVSTRVASCPEHLPILLWMPHKLLAHEEG